MSTFMDYLNSLNTSQPAPATPSGEIDYSAGPKAAGPDFYDNPQWKDFLAGIHGGSDVFQGLPNFGRQLNESGGQFFGRLLGGGAMGSDMGFANLMEILSGKGRTSPALLNRQLTGISRDTEASRAGLSGELARRNLGSSGLGLALDTAVSESGADRRSGAIADENRLTEDRMRSDLGLFRDLIIGPSTDAAALGLGQYNADANRSSTNENALISMLGQIFGSMA